ncbi:MAG: helix-turn-helix transcriptional regulator [Geodermatophilaceae bacterium]|nr:helix-turn-helix transcriptional regulator [Geodermatophilaceae bacterium]MDQ3454969.1 helix-turn-helix domain-containing protein [Actinomycetota bacterium]
MLERLGRGPASVSELARPLPMTLAAVGQHLRVLTGSGLVVTSKHGRVRTCRLAPDALAPAESWMRERRGTWETRLDRLGDVLIAAGTPTVTDNHPSDTNASDKEPG